jgi:hypothetical protein
MSFYRGPQQEDEKPQGGGRFNKDHVGHEAFNFLTVRGRLYGYFQPTVKTNYDESSISLERIDSNARRKDVIKNVLIVFFARVPRLGGQVIVGWYEGATVHRFFQKPSKAQGKPRKYWHYNLEALASDAVLLPSHVRPSLFNSKQRSDRPGQANLFYLLDTLGKPKPLSSLAWVKDALQFVNGYEGENLLLNPAANAEPTVESAIEAAILGSESQGAEPDPLVRRAIENLAMHRATSYFSRFFAVRNVASQKPYDLSCIGKRSRREVLRVEVKGTRSKGKEVILTRNEVKSARAFASCLYVLHSIKVTGRGKRAKASGGASIIINPWKLDSRHLRPIAFMYSVSTATG